MFFAARTFAMKFGQSIAMLAFTSLAIIGTTQNVNSNDIVPSETGMRVIAVVAIAFCLLGALILSFYNEKKVMMVLESRAQATNGEETTTTEEPTEEVKEEKAEIAEETTKEDTNPEEEKIEK